TLVDALQGSHRLFNGTFAKVRWPMNAKMNAEDSLSTVRRILGLAMILTGIIGTVAQFANGGTLRTSFAPSLAYAATAQAGVEMPRVDSARAPTQATAGSLGDP